MKWRPTAAPVAATNPPQCALQACTVTLCSCRNASLFWIISWLVSSSPDHGMIRADGGCFDEENALRLVLKCGHDSPGVRHPWSAIRHSAQDERPLAFPTHLVVRYLMALAINIRADNTSASEIERLWDHVAAFEDERSMRALGYRSHFTFAIYDSSEIEEKIAWEAMLRAVKGEAQLRIEFRRIRWFVGPPLVLWAEPAVDGTLTTCRWHASISAAIDPAHCRSHYRPGAWTPHCTLGTRIADAMSNDAIAFARSFDRSITVLFDVVDCVVFPPVREVAERGCRRGVP